MRLWLLRSYGHGTGHVIVCFPLLDLVVQRLKGLFDGTVFIDAVDAISEGDASCLRVCTRAEHVPTNYRRQHDAWAHLSAALSLGPTI